MRMIDLDQVYATESGRTLFENTAGGSDKGLEAFVKVLQFTRSFLANNGLRNTTLSVTELESNLVSKFDEELGTEIGNCLYELFSLTEKFDFDDLERLETEQIASRLVEQAIGELK